MIPYFNYDNTVCNLQIRRLRSLHGESGIDDHVLYYIMESLYRYTLWEYCRRWTMSQR